MTKTDITIKDYTVGKEYKTLTGGATYGIMFLMGFLMTAVMHAVNSVQAREFNVVGGIIMEGVLLAISVALLVLHFKSPQRKYTVLRTYMNQHGYREAQVQYLDGTQDTHQLGINDDGFWKQLGGFSKAALTGK